MDGLSILPRFGTAHVAGDFLRRRGIGTASGVDGLSVLPRFGAAHVAGDFLRRRGIGTVSGVDGLSVLPRFGAAHIAGNFRHRLRKAAVPVMDVAAGLALHGFHVTADFVAVFGVVRAKALAVRLQCQSRKRKHPQQQGASQTNG